MDRWSINCYKWTHLLINEYELLQWSHLLTNNRLKINKKNEKRVITTFNDLLNAN